MYRNRRQCVRFSQKGEARYSNGIVALMALNIKNPQVEKLAAEAGSRKERLETLLRQRVWPDLPADIRSVRLTKAEKERILGYGSEGF